MNSGSWSMEPISQDSLLVAVALGLAAILAILTILGMIVGARNKRRRVEADKEEQSRIDALEADGVEASDVTSTQEAPPPAAAPETAPEPAQAAPEPAPLADEPIAAAAPLDASPASVAADVPVAPAPAMEPVTRLKGLGPKIAARLEELGIVTVDQLAALSDADAAALDAQLAPFQGRMERDRWREQARLLAAGDRAGFEREFGRLG